MLPLLLSIYISSVINAGMVHIRASGDREGEKGAKLDRNTIKAEHIIRVRKLLNRGVSGQRRIQFSDYISSWD